MRVYKVDPIVPTDMDEYHRELIDGPAKDTWSHVPEVTSHVRVASNVLQQELVPPPVSAMRAAPVGVRPEFRHRRREQSAREWFAANVFRVCGWVSVLGGVLLVGLAIGRWTA